MRFKGEIIQPSKFIPAAERYGIIEQLDRHIVAKAFAHLAGLDNGIMKSVCYFINISGVTLSSGAFSEFVEHLLEIHPAVEATQVCFEVTETAAVSDVRRSAAAMTRLSSIGFRFALDDFGSGMASFAYLNQLPVHFVKIDGDFVRDILTNPASEIMVEAVAKLAKCMGKATIAEAVETQQLIPKLRTLGIDFGQGYALHRPEPLGHAVLTGATAVPFAGAIGGRDHRQAKCSGIDRE